MGLENRHILHTLHRRYKREGEGRMGVERSSTTFYGFQAEVSCLPGIRKPCHSWLRRNPDDVKGSVSPADSSPGTSSRILFCHVRIRSKLSACGRDIDEGAVFLDQIKRLLDDVAQVVDRTYWPQCKRFPKAIVETIRSDAHLISEPFDALVSIRGLVKSVHSKQDAHHTFDGCDKGLLDKEKVITTCLVFI